MRKKYSVHSGNIIDGLLASEVAQLKLLELSLCSLPALSNSSTKVTVRDTRGLNHIELRTALVDSANYGRDAEWAHVTIESISLCVHISPYNSYPATVPAHSWKDAR